MNGAAGADEDVAGNDEFIVGYVTAILERDFSLTDDSFDIRVSQGTVTLNAGKIQERDRDKVVAALSRIRGVRRVVIVDGAPRSPAVPPYTGGGWSLFPDERLFRPLVADPRWPHFSTAYLHFHRSGSPKLVNVGAISLGETINLAGYDSPSFGKVNLGLQPAVFGLFNLDAPYPVLVNADYLIALPVDYRNGFFSAQARMSHLSSHLGDEYLLSTRIRRIDLSYETVDLRLSADLGAFRIYAGGGRIIHVQKRDLRPWSAQLGAEFVSPRTILHDTLRPVVAVDVQAREESEWEPDYSLRAGVEFSSPEKGRKRVELLLEYFHGRNPNGQFFQERIETFGIGLHVHF